MCEDKSMEFYAEWRLRECGFGYLKVDYNETMGLDGDFRGKAFLLKR